MVKIKAEVCEGGVNGRALGERQGDLMVRRMGEADLCLSGSPREGEGVVVSRPLGGLMTTASTRPSLSHSGDSSDLPEKEKNSPEYGKMKKGAGQIHLSSSGPVGEGKNVEDEERGEVKGMHSDGVWLEKRPSPPVGSNDDSIRPSLRVGAGRSDPNGPLPFDSHSSPLDLNFVTSNFVSESEEERKARELEVDSFVESMSFVSAVSAWEV
mmetsp:Transcript_7876/g.15347  ORF Transcript_7876/g.15347 Transcript_7876/m.15347 type:complete len:211 (+) Transcript_7876:78-710(+)